MIPAYNKKRCAAVPFETGIHFRRKTDFFPEEDTTKSYSGFEPEPIRLQAEGIARAKLMLDLLAAEHILHLYFGTWDTGAIFTVKQKKSLGYANTLQDATTVWSSDDSASETRRKHSRRHLLQIV
ncbi:poly polymerase [Trichonephila clavipes]|nr:poly polymerase [Trichonephila clavipes]